MFSVFVAGQMVGSDSDMNKAYQKGLAYECNMINKPAKPYTIEVRNPQGIRVLVKNC